MTHLCFGILNNSYVNVVSFSLLISIITFLTHRNWILLLIVFFFLSLSLWDSLQKNVRKFLLHEWTKYLEYRQFMGILGYTGCWGIYLLTDKPADVMYEWWGKCWHGKNWCYHEWVGWRERRIRWMAGYQWQLLKLYKWWGCVKM